ncbi:MAG: DUF6350 family protein [Propionicimonas sp.]|uniref:cell division protein PerM n=1 Tax=Propionicimonas sp. TaxID=1955623 RepID=UPI003D09E967
MPMPRFRDSERLRLTTSSARTVRLAGATDGPPLLPWPVAAVGGGVLAALAGAVLVAGVVLVAWLSAIAIALPTVLGFAAQVWLLAHGGVLVIGDVGVSLVPLGLTAAFVLLCMPVGRFAYRQARLARTGDVSPRDDRRLVLGSVGQVALGYTLVAAALAWGFQGPALIWRPALGAIAVSVLGSALGAVRASGYRPWATWPAWLRRGLRGAAAGGLALVVVSSVALAVAVVLGEAGISTLEQAVGFDTGGVFVWSLITLAYLPTALGWALSWLLGAGFTVGTGSLVSLSGTQLGMLPSIPLLAALPSEGAADPWMLAWLSAGVAAGALAGVVAARAGRRGVLGTLAAAATAGLLAGIVFLGWAAASRGALGSLRLVDLGPRLWESLLIGVPLLLLSAVLAGLVTWLFRRGAAAS